MSDFDFLFDGDVVEAAPQPAKFWPETCPTAQLAVLLGLSTRSIRELSERSLIKPASRGQWPTVESANAYIGDLREKAAGRANGNATLTDERTRLAKEQADKIELQNAALRRELIPARDVETSWASVCRDIRSAIIAIPSRCGSALPHLTPADIATIDAEIRAALEGLSNDNA